MRNGSTPVCQGESRTKNNGPLLQVENVCKAYPVWSLTNLLLFKKPKHVNALNGVSLKLQPGQVAALLGPNGAGKTTLINMLCGLTIPDSGSICVAGRPVPEKTLEAQNKIGYVNTNDRSFFWRLTGRQNLEFFAVLQGLSTREATKRTQEMLEIFGLADHADRFFNTYSAGMKKRLGLGRALIHNPDVVLMDEPTNGMDAESTEDLLDFVRNKVRTAGKGVLWATHRSDEVERLCDSVFVLGDGKIKFDGSINEFRELCRKKSGYVVEAKISTENRMELIQYVEQIDNEAISSQTDHLLEVAGIRDEERLSLILKEFLDKGAVVKKVERQAEPLHEVFMQLTARS